MKKLILMTALISQLVYAHDDGHGPKLGDQPEYGGKVTAVIDKDEVDKGTKAELLYKAELTKNNQNVVRVYLYDKKMKSLKLDDVSEAYAELISKDKETQKWKKTKFSLEQERGSFSGKIPGTPQRPFNIDVTLKRGDQALFMAFDNLN